MGEGARSKTRMEPHSGKRRPGWTASSQETGPKGVGRGLVDLSTISNGSTHPQGIDRAIADALTISTSTANK